MASITPAGQTGRNLADRVREAVRAYPDWSRAERAKLWLVEEEILAHCRDGQGNGFVAWWCDVWLPRLLPAG